jgi:hypothetical protein
MRRSMATSNGSLLPLSRSSGVLLLLSMDLEGNVEGLEFASQILIGTCVKSLATGFQNKIRLS